MTFQHHFQHKACTSNCFALSKSPTPLHSCGEQTRHVCHSRRKLSTAPSGRRNASSDLAFFRRLERDHGFQRSWSRSRLRNGRRLRRRRVPRVPLLRRPAWCRQQWQRLEYHYQGACHSEFTVDYMDARDTAGNSTRSSRTFVMIALHKEQRARSDEASTSHGDVHGKERCCRCGDGKEKHGRVSIKRWHAPETPRDPSSSPHQKSVILQWLSRSYRTRRRIGGSHVQAGLEHHDTGVGDCVHDDGRSSDCLVRGSESASIPKWSRMLGYLVRPTSGQNATACS